ncbi:MAG TPA: penicillin acylase family protein [Anaerolineae bacterium]|nr:penicillin acylase family protein [Anaerolineae bacterium]
MKRAARFLLIALAALFLVALLAAAWFVRRPWPQVDGEISLPGLSAPVEVLRDAWGVPTLYAENDHDLFFAQGYVHAQDRLWQMEFNRRVGTGTLSAALGPSTLPTDRLLRTLGLGRAAERDWVLLDDDTRAILEAYAAGVNAYVDAHRGRLPLEFTLVGVDPEPWTPIDSLAWGKVMALFLGHNYQHELLRARLVADLGPDAAAQLMPPYPGDGPFVIPPEAGAYDWLQGRSVALTALAPLVDRPTIDWGSNNWVLHGSRTATGQPILANDMHLGLDMPSIWYEIGLHGGRFTSLGYSFPGAPGVIVGHNGRIAWGVTTLPADVQDLYVERLDEAGTRYEFDGQWHDLEIVREIIEVKGAAPETLEVRITRHGPIVNDVVGDLAGAEPLALRWTALDGTRLFQAVVLLNLADDWDDFRDALRYWEAPSQHFVYADVAGNVGYQTPGLIPIRAAGHDGSVPVPGWTGAYEWSGYLPFDELPSALNPPAGLIVSANNKVASAAYPHHIATDWSAPFRAQRITDLLGAGDRFSADDMRAIHADTYSLPAEALRPYLLAAAPAGEQQATALSLVEQWDLYNESDRVGASIYHAWYAFLVRNTFAGEMAPDLFDTYLGFSNVHVPALIALMAHPDSLWFDDGATPAIETRDEIVKRSLDDAIAWLQAEYGDDPDGWTWGRLHPKTFVHQPLGQSGVALLEKLFSAGPIEARGESFSVDAAGFSYRRPFHMGAGVSQRMVLDLANLDASRSIHTTGQSGQLFHRHRADMIPLWENVDYHPFPFTRPAVEAQAEEVLTLSPR